MKLFLPTNYTCVRVNTQFQNIDEVQLLLQSFINNQCDERSLQHLKVLKHNKISDCLVVPTKFYPKRDILEKYIIVDYLCGMAVIRGADIYYQGVLCAPTTLKRGDTVSVYVDLSKKCLKGSKTYEGTKLYLGNGYCHMSRKDIFMQKHDLVSNLAVELKQPIFHNPSLNNVLNSKIFLQNLPSLVAGLVVGAQPYETVLDMCAAPGGKSTHLFAQMKGKGRLVAIDRSKSKLKKIHKNFEKLYKSTYKENVQIISLDSATLSPKVCQSRGIPNEYDRILLDTPCSALGQRPRLCSDTLITDHVKTYPVLQRNLLKAAVSLLKYEGTLVYCTCTTTMDENENMVAWLLKTFPEMQLATQKPFVGSFGRSSGCTLSSEQLELLQYFHMVEGTSIKQNKLDYKPINQSNGNEMLLEKSCVDTNAFFIAKFIKSRK